MNRMNIIVCLFAGCALMLFGACSSDSGQTDAEFRQIVINPERSDSPEYENWVKGIEYIPLETRQECLVGGDIQDLVFHDDKFYILSDRKRVQCFDRDGKFLFNVGYEGRGPGEYSLLSNISIDDGVVYAFCMNERQLHSYDASTGKFIKSYKLSKNYSQVVVRDGYIYVAEVNLDGEKSRFVIDVMPLKNIEEVTRLYASAEGEKIYGTWKQLFSSKDCLVWVDDLRGKVWRLVEGKMESWLDFDFGENEWSDEALLAGEFSTGVQSKVTMIPDFYVKGDDIYFEYGCNNKLYSVYYNLKTGNYYNVKFLSYTTSKPYYKQPFVKCATDRWIGIMLVPYRTFEGDDSIPVSFSTYNRLKGLKNDESNPVICIYDMR
ncbi:MAG: 6-bladed beta-propeller [Alistipes sp.]|nr:6-bladed beta-propeller [Alistipes sp.]